MTTATGTASALPHARAAQETVLDGLRTAATHLRASGVPVPEPEGKLLRPLVAYALVPPSLRATLDERFWNGALAVQMVHEASLLHDDILDRAPVRRGEDTFVARAGVGPALVLGDHWLTGAYRAAAAADCSDFLGRFILAVERTVAGEVAQGRAAGMRLPPGEYHGIITGKSGELFGAAAVLGGALLGLRELDERVGLGRDFGALYQRIDDLLDYCPAADTGKPALQDWGQRKWTWVLDLAGVEDFAPGEADLLRTLFLGRNGSPSPARRALDTLAAERDALLRRVRRIAPGDTIVSELLEGWVRLATEAVLAQERALTRPPERPSAAPASAEARVVEMARSIGGPEAWPAYFGRHARTFRFAARWFPAGPAALVRGLYAYCRFTDDLVDEADPSLAPSVREARLDAWRLLSREAFEGHRTGIPLLDHVLGEAGTRGVSWRYPDALLEGAAMDLAPRRYPDWDALQIYTFNVAGAVGGWMTQLLGFQEPSLLERAHALGHAMQLTNILRDVGEDLQRGRLYLPETLLRAHGLDEERLRRIRSGIDAVPDTHRRAMEHLMERADAEYARAWPGIRALPGWYRRPVAVAAACYRGIHREVRRNGYDNLRLRAHTSPGRKALLAAAVLLRGADGPVRRP